MSKRTSIVRPEAALPAVGRVSKSAGKQSLHEQLKAGYEANAEESLEIAVDWFPVDGGDRVAVGTPVAQRPPHRSVRER